MSSQTLVPFAYIPENSQATPGLWNSVFSTLSQNIALVNSNATLTPPSGNTLTVGSDLSVLGTIAVSGPVRVGLNSNVTNYLFLSDTSNARSNYVIGSQVGGTADGLNIWDDSGQTMIVAFSKQSVRFYQNVVGSAFDIGGSEFNVRAFGAVGDGVHDDTSAVIAAISALPTNGGVIKLPSGTYLVSQTINLSKDSTGKNAITLQGSGNLATTIKTSVTTMPGIVSGDTFSQNVLADFALYQTGNALPAFRSGNYGIRNVGVDAPSLLIQNVRVRYFGDVGIQVQGGQGPFALQNVEVQSCASWGVHLVPLGASAPEEVEILAGNIHVCVGGLRLTGAISTGVFDTDIELGTSALYPAVQIDGGAVGGTIVDISCSVQTAISNGSAVIYISNGFGFVFTGGQCVTSAASIDCIRLDSTAARLNAFLGGYYSSASGGWYANVINGAKQNVFRHPTLGAFTAGFGKVNNSTNTADTIEFVGSSAVSDDRSLVLGGTLSVGTGAAVFPAFNFGGSEVSLGWFRSAASTMALSYGSLVIGSSLDPGGASALRVGGSVLASGNITANGNVVGTGQVKATGASAVLIADNRAAAGTNMWQLYNPSGADLRFFQGADNVVMSTTELAPGSTALLKLGLPARVWGDSYLTRLFVNSGAAINPTIAVSSESSLGWYRSAASVMALSYGGLGMKNGTNASFGTAVLGSNGSVNVATTYVAAGDVIFLTDQTAGGTLGDIEIGGIRAGSGFTIQSTSITDTSTVGWLIVRAAV